MHLQGKIGLKNGYSAASHGFIRQGLHALDLAESEQTSIPPYIGLPKVRVSPLEIQRALPQIGGKTHTKVHINADL